jgi:hypothetical protein
MTDDGLTFVGIEYDLSFIPRAWIWHVGDEDASPLHPELAIDRISISGDGSTLIGSMPVPGTFDLQGFVIRNGEFDLLSYPGAITTIPYSASADGSAIAGEVYTLDPNPNIVHQDAVIWRADGSVTLVPLPGAVRSSPVGISANGATVFGWAQYNSPSRTLPFIWRAGDAESTVIDSGVEQFTTATYSTRDGSVVVGGGEPGYLNARGFVWRNGVVEILEPKAGWQACRAVAASAEGYRIVGQIWGPTEGVPTRQECIIWDGDRPPELLRDLLAAAGAPVEPAWLESGGTTGSGEMFLGQSFDPNAPGGSQYRSYIAILPIITPADLIDILIGKVQGSSIAPGIRGQLLFKLAIALAALESGSDGLAIFAIDSFISQVEQHSGNAIPQGVANEWIADAEEVLELLGS